MKYREKTVAAILDHLDRGGTVEGSCGCAGISKSTFYIWLDEHPEFSDAVELAKNRAIHRAETELDKAIAAGNINALTFWLRCRAGYSFHEKREITGSLEVKKDREHSSIIEQAWDRFTGLEKATIVRALNTGNGKKGRVTEKDLDGIGRGSFQKDDNGSRSIP